MTKYTEELGIQIAALIGEGNSMRSICRRDGMPNLTTIYAWRRAHPEFDRLLVQAKEDQGDSLFDDIAECLKELDEKDLSMARVSAIREKLHALQWSAARLKPQAYGQAKQDAIALTSYVDALRVINESESGRRKPAEKHTNTRATLRKIK